MAGRLAEHDSSQADGSEGVVEGMARTVPAGSNSTIDENSPEEKPAMEQSPQQQKGEEKKPSKLKKLWEKSGLDLMTIMMMIKGGLAPTIAIAMYQATSVAAIYQTLGYLIAIASILGFAIMPRGKFIQNMALEVVAVCFAAAINLLALYCVVKAREHTTPPPPPGVPPVVGYNSSASAVCAVWLILQIYLVNVLRAARPQFQFPAILYSIFVVVSLTYGTQFPNMTYAISFMKRLLEAFLTGFAIATGVHIMVFPTSSRKVVLKEMAGYLNLLNGTLKTQTAYMASLEEFDPDAVKAGDDGKIKDGGKKSKSKHHKESGEILLTPAAIKLKAILDKVLELHTKLHGDITPAKREIAVGMLESHDLTELWKLMRMVFLPVLGLGSMFNLLERWAEVSGWKKDSVTEEEDKARHEQLDSMHFLMKNLHEPFASMTATIDEAFQHVLLTLELVKPDKKAKQPDEESQGDEPPKPGTSGFAEAYKKKVDGFYESKQRTLQVWCHQYGIELPPDFFESSFVYPEEFPQAEELARERHQRQLFFTLYLEYLLWRVSTSVLDLILYVEKRKQEGAFKSSKIIFPGSKTLYKWFRAVWGEEDISEEGSFTADLDAGGSQTMYLGVQFANKKDPEHLPPRNALERIGDKVRLIPKFFRSEASSFGLRVVAASMTLGIICFLEQTQAFFLTQRLLWSMIMIAMSMNRTSGQSIFNFVLRVFGTFVAMVVAYIVWYIVDGRTPGVIVFLWLWITCAFYVILKVPKFIIVGILSIITSVLIIGYELQVRKIGVTAATSNGQPAYTIYVLAPYRLATVAGGLFVAFIWTIFPYPISESTELRKDLAASLFLMCNFYENVRETVGARIHGIGGNSKTKGTHAYNLEKARLTIFSKLVLVLNNLKTNAAFSKFQIRVGGRFPMEEYEDLIACMQRLLLWSSLASYASTSFQDANEQGLSVWSSDFRKVMSSVDVTNNRITSLLSLLSSSLSNGQPLPPYLELPEPFQFVKKINAIDRDILSIRHIAEPEYSAFAVMQVVSQSTNADIVRLAEHVKNLVGEIDFSFHGVKSSSSSSVASSEDSIEKGKEE